MNEQSDLQLLQAYGEGHSEEAFTELVGRHLDFVYSASLRMVCDPHLAEDVSQAVFVALAKNVRKLKDRAILSGWLHRTAQNIAAQTVRTIERRRAREQQAVAMNELLAGEADNPWSQIVPHLDTALGHLSEPDRDALFLRYFEHKSARDIALTLCISDAAAQKRINRALERLRQLFIKRGVTVGANGLIVAISSNAVQAAPPGLHLLVSGSTALTATSLASNATITASKAIAMTSLQKSIAAATIAILAGGGLYKAHHNSQLRDQVQTLLEQQAPLAGQIERLLRDRDDTALQLSALRADNERLKGEAAELVKLRNEIYNLRQDQSAPGGDPAGAALTQESIGRELGMAIVRGEPGAVDKLSELAKARLASFNTNSIGLDDTQRGDLGQRAFVPLRSAFKVIEEAAIQNNEFAVDAVVKCLLIPELQANAVQIIGILAGNGNDDALEVLLNQNYGFPLSTIVSALEPAAERGYEKAIDTLAAVTNDPKNQALWFMAANGLSKAAASGNSTAVRALIGLSQSTNSNIKSASVVGLEGAANHQNPEAIEALRGLSLR